MLSSDGVLPGCLLEDTVLGFVEGRLPAPATQQVKAHMDQCPDCRELVVATARSLGRVGGESRVQAPAGATQPAGTTLAGDGEGPPSPSSAPLRQGSAIGRYLVLSPIGAGGMGIVYEAYDPKLERKIALKLLRTDGWARADGRACTSLPDRLLREAQSMARLCHPNVVIVHDTGTIDGQVFIAMEHVAGRTLSDWLREGPRQWQEVLGVWKEAGQGLVAAHAAGLIHRDFKPDNVLVGTDGRVLVTDFGLARPTQLSEADMDAEATRGPPAALGEARLLPGTLTRQGAWAGTPAYMAPELFLGRPADQRTDQFSFCVALHEGLYGQKPFAGATLEELVESLQKGRLREPPRDARVPQWLRRVLLRGLSVDPEGRFPSMEALLLALSRDRRTRWRRALTVTALAGLIVTGAFGYQQGQRQRGLLCREAEGRLGGVFDEARKRAIRQAFLRTDLPYARDAWNEVARALEAYTRRWVQLYTEACEATRVRGEQSEELLDLRMQCLSRRLDEVRALSTLWSEADARVVEKAVAASAGLSDVEDCARTTALRTWLRPEKDPALRARAEALRAQLSRAKALKAGGKLLQALPLSRELVSTARQIDSLPVEAEALCLQGEVQAALGDFAAAAPTLQEAVAVAQACQHDEVAAQAWIDLIDAAGYRLGQYENGHRYGRYARATLDRLGAAGRLEAQRLEHLGLVLAGQGRYEEALSRLRLAIATARRGADGDLLTIARATEAMAIVFTNQGKPREALELERQALGLMERPLGTQHPALARTLNNLGYMLWTVGRYDEALPHLTRSLSIFQRAMGNDPPESAVVLDTLGRVLTSMGRYAQAIEYLQHARLLRQASRGGQHPDVARILNGLGRVYLQKKNFATALGMHREALPILEKALGPEHPEIGATLHELGEVLQAQGHLEEAREHYERARRIIDKALGAQTAASAAVLTSIGEVALLQGRPAEALGPLRLALLVREAQEGDPGDLSRTRFALGRALWKSGQDRGRARELVLQAKEEYRRSRYHQEELAEVEAWSRRALGR